jgi:hypothetical protein
MEEELGRGLDCASRQRHRCHSMMFHSCLTKKILIRGLVSPRDHTSQRLCSNKPGCPRMKKKGLQPAEDNNPDFPQLKLLGKILGRLAVVLFIVLGGFW